MIEQAVWLARRVGNGISTAPGPGLVPRDRPGFELVHDALGNGSEQIKCPGDTPFKQIGRASMARPVTQ